MGLFGNFSKKNTNLGGTDSTDAKNVEETQLNADEQIEKDVIYICEDDFLQPSDKDDDDEIDEDETEDETDNDESEVVSTDASERVMSGGVMSMFGAAMGIMTLGAINAVARVASSVNRRYAALENVQYVPLKTAKDFFAQNNLQVQGVNRFSKGLILIRHPFLPNTFINIDATESELFHLKMLCLSSIMQYLGAKSISGHAKLLEEKHRELDVNGNLSYASVQIDAQYASEQKQRYESEYRLEDTFSGDFSAKSYQLAIEEATKCGLDKDFEVKHLIAQRNPAKPRSITSRKVSIELSRELNNALDVAFELKVVGVEFNANYKEILENRRKVLFELEIQF